jgi:hypothetical protein
MDRGRIGKERGGKETDGCPLTSHFDGDRAQGNAFLTSCELYISPTALDVVDEQVCIHSALSYFKGRHVASFTELILQQELRSGKVCFA